MRKASAQGVLYGQLVAERLGISSTDLECLDFIVLRGPMTAGELAAATGLTTGAITGVIDRLERAGFVRRERDHQDRRKVHVHGLPAVERRVAPLFLAMQRAMSAAVEGYGDEEIELLLSFFARAHEAAVAATATLRAAAVPAEEPAGRRTSALRRKSPAAARRRR